MKYYFVSFVVCYNDNKNYFGNCRVGFTSKTISNIKHLEAKILKTFESAYDVTILFITELDAEKKEEEK